MSRTTCASRAASLLLLPLAVFGLGACATGPDITSTRVTASVDVAFQRVYAQREKLLPRLEARDVDFHPTCHRLTPSTHDVGPGADWACPFSWIDGTGTKQTAKIDVQVRSNSCWTAGPPGSLVGLPQVTDASGKSVPNPALEFDGCFNPYA